MVNCKRWWLLRNLFNKWTSNIEHSTSNVEWRRHSVGRKKSCKL